MKKRHIYLWMLLISSLSCFGQNLELYLSKAELLEKQGKKDSAIAVLASGMASLPLDSTYKLYVKHGYISMSIQKNEAAEKYFKKALDIKPSLPSAYAALGYLYMNVGKFELALQNFNKAFGFGDKTELLIFCRGHTYWDLKICDSATMAMNQTIAMNLQHENGNYLRGRISAYLGKHNEALQDYAIGLQLVPLSKQAEVYGYRGISLFELKKYAEAYADLEMSTKGGMKRPEIVSCYEKVKKELGKK